MKFPKQLARYAKLMEEQEMAPIVNSEPDRGQESPAKAVPQAAPAAQPQAGKRIAFDPNVHNPAAPPQVARSTANDLTGAGAQAQREQAEEQQRLSQANEDERRRMEARKHAGIPTEAFLRGDPSDETAINHCVVCGQGSHRADWGKNLKDDKGQPKTGLEPQGPFVCCDNHSQEEFQNAIAQVKEKAGVLGLKPEEKPLRGVHSDLGGKGDGRTPSPSGVAPDSASRPASGPSGTANAQTQHSTTAQPQRTPSADATVRSNPPAIGKTQAPPRNLSQPEDPSVSGEDAVPRSQIPSK